MRDSKNAIQFSTAQTLFTFFFLVLFFTLLNGYLQNLVADYRANAWLVLLGIVVELGATLWLARRRVDVQFDPLELAGFLLVVIGVWAYFIAPALPTLLPPTQSSDAVRVYLQVLFSYPEGKLVSWYPAGGAFVAAMFARWLDVAPLRVLHPTAASFLALSAGAVYGIACALLPQRRVSKIAALIAPALLFVPWSYFAGALDWEQYFFAQVFAQYFILAALWYSASYAEQPHWMRAALIGAALLGVIAAYPIFVALPLALFGLIVAANVRPAFGSALKLLIVRSSLRFPGAKVPTTNAKPDFPNTRLEARRTLITLGVFIALMLLAAAALQRGGILEILAGQKSVTLDVGAGGVTNPSLENLGGPIFLALALAGAWGAWRRGAFGKTILGLLIVWVMQFIALVALQPYWQISGYRVDKTFYILVFPLALLAALPPAWALDRLAARVTLSARALVAGLVATIVVLSAGVLALRPPIAFAPLTESEIQVALWAKEFYSETYHIAYLDQSTISAYWLAFGLWRETLPNEWFQWIPAGRKLGPATFDEWLRDPGWHDRILVRDVKQAPGNLRVVYQTGASALLDKDPPPDLGPKPPYRSDVNFDGALTLIGYDLPRHIFQPGETITLTTWTQSLYPPGATVAWRVELVDRAGNVVRRVERAPFGDKYPLQRWPPGKFARDDWALELDPALPPGAYALRMALFRRADGELIDVRSIYADNPTPMPAAPITQIKIPLPPPSAAELRAAKPLHARVGDEFTLTSYALQTDRAARRVHLQLYWQAIAKTANDYTVFVHVLDAAGKVVAQRDAPPRGGTYPTSLWDPGEIVKDEYDLVVPADARAPFALEIGMYAQPSLKRLPVGEGDHIEFKISDF